MTQERLKELSEIYDELSNMRDKIDIIANEEQEEFDDMSIGFKMSRDGLIMESGIKDLGDTFYHLEEAMNYLIDFV